MATAAVIDNNNGRVADRAYHYRSGKGECVQLIKNQVTIFLLAVRLCFFGLFPSARLML